MARKRIWNDFCESVKNYGMIQENDRIAVCFSGDMNSIVMLQCLKNLQEKKQILFGIKCVVIFSKEDEQLNEKLKEIVARWNITNYETFYGNDKTELYEMITKLGCNKIALNQNYNNMIEATLMSLSTTKQVEVMLPKFMSPEFEKVEFIRPFCLVKEEDIEEAWDHNNEFILSYSCGFTHIATRTYQDLCKPKTKKKFQFRVYQSS